ncbi:hypothetical protein ACQKMD_21630 [Viridibacillus sp. NPDC096237]|uniref:hypothetical protein n=1 Tax=Viridibacillus sp. NPDC096237 TaxID=3390721 RepID=UPI003D0520A7
MYNSEVEMLLDIDLGVIRKMNVSFYPFESTKKIGEVSEIDGEYYLIIGIECFEITQDKMIEIIYIVQDLSKNQFVPQNTEFIKPRASDEIEVSIQCEFNDPRVSNFKLGNVLPVTINQNRYFYRLLEYTCVDVIESDIRLSTIMRPIVPVNYKDAKKIFRKERMRKMEFKVL